MKILWWLVIALIIFNEDVDGVKSLTDYGVLIDEISITVKNEINEQKEKILGLLLGTLGTSI